MRREFEGSFDEKLKECEWWLIVAFYAIPIIHFFSIFFLLNGPNKTVSFLVMMMGLLSWYGEIKLYRFIGFRFVITNQNSSLSKKKELNFLIEKAN